MNISITQLFRRCLLLASAILITGCASTNSPAPVEEYGVSQVVAQVPSTPIVKVLDKSFALETPQSNNKVVRYLMDRFKLSPKVAEDILSIATRNAYEDFPKRNDILAIIAVESSYRVKALLRGCYGLMQVERKSHAKQLAGRSLYDPAVNVEMGASILHQYYASLHGNNRAAILSYNAGIGSYKSGRYSTAYYVKYKKELEKFNNI